MRASTVLVFVLVFILLGASWLITRDGTPYDAADGRRLYHLATFHDVAKTCPWGEYAFGITATVRVALALCAIVLVLPPFRAAVPMFLDELFVASLIHLASTILFRLPQDPSVAPAPAVVPLENLDLLVAFLMARHLPGPRVLYVLFAGCTFLYIYACVMRAVGTLMLALICYAAATPRQHVRFIHIPFLIGDEDELP